jgi:hypothetical protein
LKVKYLQAGLGLNRIIFLFKSHFKKCFHCSIKVLIMSYVKKIFCVFIFAELLICFLNLMLELTFFLVSSQLRIIHVLLHPSWLIFFIGIVTLFISANFDEQNLTSDQFLAYLAFYSNADHFLSEVFFLQRQAVFSLNLSQIVFFIPFTHSPPLLIVKILEFRHIAFSLFGELKTVGYLGWAVMKLFFLEVILWSKMCYLIERWFH